VSVIISPCLQGSTTIITLCLNAFHFYFLYAPWLFTIASTAVTPADAGRVLVQRIASMQSGGITSASASASSNGNGDETPDDEELDLIYDVRCIFVVFFFSHAEGYFGYRGFAFLQQPFTALYTLVYPPSHFSFHSLFPFFSNLCLSITILGSLLWNTPHRPQQLMDAVKEGQLDLMMELLRTGANINCTDEVRYSTRVFSFH
jgi:hypothetical protein